MGLLRVVVVFLSFRHFSNTYAGHLKFIHSPEALLMPIKALQAVLAFGMKDIKHVKRDRIEPTSSL